MAVHTSIFHTVAPPPFHVIGGAWTQHASLGAKPKPTGNFSFTIAGEVDFQVILPFADHFICPLLKGVLYPGDKWVYVQLHGVPMKNPQGIVYDGRELLDEVQ